MPSAQGIRAGRAYVELGVGDKLTAGLKRAQARLRAFGASLTRWGAKIAGIGGALAAPLSLTIKGASDLEETMNKFGVVFGSQAAAMQAWGDEFGKTVGRSKNQVRSFLAEAQDLFVPIGFEPGAAAKLSKTITSLAVDLASFNNMADADVMRDLKAALTGSSEVMKKYGVIVNEAAVKQELLNRGLDPQAATNQQKVMARLAIIMRGTTAAQGDAVRSAGSFANTMKRLKANLADASAEIGSALLPVVTPLVSKLAATAKVVGTWIAQNKGLVVAVAQLAAGAVAAGIGLALFGKIAAGVGLAVGALATGLKLLGVLLGAIVSPIGLVITAVGALGGYLLYASGAAGKALGWLGDKFSTLKQEAMAAYQGIADALAAGDIGLAAKILWLTLKLQWKRGVAALLGVWLGFKHGFLKLVYGTWYGAQALGELIWHGMEIGWIETTSFFSQTWAKFVGFFKQTWENMKAAAQKAWVWIKSLFDESVDVDAEYGKIDEARNEAFRRIADERNRALHERELRRQREREAEERRHQGRLLEIGKAHEAKKDAMAAERGSRMAAAEKELRDARQEWQDALEAASAKRKKQEAEDAGPGRLKGAEELLSRIQSATAGLGEKLRTTVRGTFNVAAIGGFASGSAMDRTAAATEQTAKNTKKIERTIAMGGSAFV